jgi:pimeloyl-ACP methyl ester carboxylesterase
MENDLVPFRIDIPESALLDLHRRLDATRWPDELPGIEWAHGIPLATVRELADHWRHRYDWRRAEARLNALPQWKTHIDGQDVHFIHVRSSSPHALPLVLTHGWPGTVAEFLDVVGPLTEPQQHRGSAKDAFHVVIPSLPGFGFSGPTHERGWDPRRIAKAWATLMARLGYARYGAQGGDWGSMVSRELGFVDPQHLVGVHLNNLHAPPTDDGAGLTALEQSHLLRAATFRREGMAYVMLQATRPQTLAYGLTDSPVGLLAWLGEKLLTWTDARLDRDVLLTHVMIYWLTSTFASSARLYAEGGAVWGPPVPSTVPMAVAVGPRDLVPAIRRYAEQTNQIVQWTELPRGGHFAALEVPELLVADMRTFFAHFRASLP